MPTAAEAAGGGKDAPPVHAEGELEEFNEDFDYHVEVWRSLEAEREAAGFKPGWSVFRFEERFGFRPIVAGGELIDARDSSRENKAKVYRGLLAEANQRGFAAGWAGHKYRELFGVWPRGLGVDDGKAERLREKYLAMRGVGV